MTMTRREFHRCLAAGLATSLLPGLARARPAAERLRVAAIQMRPRLGDVQANLAQAEQLISEARRRGAQWIALPEMFSSAAAFHPGVLAAVQPLHGAPAQLLRDQARAGHCVIGGSFLAQRRAGTFNTFLLALPDGGLHRHDKDLPTYWENCYCLKGDDDGVLPSPVGEVGAALCWEFIRTQTARRLKDRCRLVIGGSCWWTLRDEAEATHPMRALNLNMLRQAPVRFARMLGVPVIHGSHAGPFQGYDSPELPDVPYNSRYLGEAAVIDANGTVLARRDQAQGPGVAIADIELPARPAPSLEIPVRYWLPENMPRPWKDAWRRWFPRGADYYAQVTRPYLESGEVREYEPPYMRE